MNPTVEIGGKVILMEEPSNGQHCVTHFIPDTKVDAFMNDLSNLDGTKLKELQGPLINGLWAGPPSSIRPFPMPT